LFLRFYYLYQFGYIYDKDLDSIPEQVYYRYMKESLSPLSALVKLERKRTGITQEKLALMAGVGLRFIRDLEQGKATLRLDKVDQVLRLFGYRTGPVRMEKPDA
jgi:y4mF family transcriptional regulator